MALLEVRSLSVEFPTASGLVRAVSDLSFSIERGETVGIVGESGSGKSVTALAIMGLVDPPGRITTGEISLDGTPILGAPERRMLDVRGKRIAMIFQEPSTSLNPILSIRDQMGEALDQEVYDAWRGGALRGLGKRLARLAQPARARALSAQAGALLEEVGIPDAAGVLRRYPYTLSGGMMQRAMIAMALAPGPDLLIADEPTTALDVTIQAQVLDILRERRERSDLSILLITHDLGLVAELCDRVIVMYAGQMMEQASVHDTFARPRHPYTRGLLASMPSIEAEVDRLPAIEGSVPDVTKLPAEACHFAWSDRCPLSTHICRGLRPVLSDLPDGSRVACHVYTHPEMTGLRERLETQVWPPAARPEPG